MKLVAFDASDQLIASLREGAIGLKLSGQNPERKMDSGAALIRREDLERGETRQLLFPDIQKYLKAN